MRVMLIADRPESDDARRELDLFLGMGGLHRAGIAVTYLVDHKEDITLADVSAREPSLIQEISHVRPLFILSVGRNTTRWLLGPVDMDAVHGTPRHPRPGLLQPHPSLVVPTVIPCYSPAFGLHDPDAKGLVYYDYQQAAAIIKGKVSAEPVVDTYDQPSYMEIDDPRRIKMELDGMDTVAIDTEGIPGNEWSFQFSSNPGTGVVVRASSRWFRDCVRVFRDYLERARPLTIVHNAMYDLEMVRGLGVDLRHARLYDTMVAAYLLRLEPQSLKHLARRHCGMGMMEYREMIGDAADEKRNTYLWSILEHFWEPPEPRVVVENDLTTRIYRPQSIERRVEAILLDWDTARDNLATYGRFVVKLDSKEDFDVVKRFRAIDPILRAEIEAKLGPLPDATLDDVPLERAIRYSGRDPDATLRVFRRIAPMVEAAGVADRHALIMSNLPSIEEMQSTGMFASRPRFEALRDQCQSEMESLCSKLSSKFNDGQPINPNSGDQVAALMHRRGLVGLKKSRITRKMSTSKKSIEHLRHEDEAIAIVEDWRERGKTRDSFTAPILERIPPTAGASPIRCNIRVTRVSSSRLSASDPPLLAIPIRHELGVAVRSGFIAPTAQDLIDHYGVELEDAGDTFLGGWDLSQIEMRWAAHDSNDPLMCQLFREERDIHAETAIKIFGLADHREWDEKKFEWVYPSVHKKKHRDPTKRAGFGVLTGISGAGLLDQLRMMGCEGWTEDSCDDLIVEWFKVYRGVEKYLLACRAECRDKGFIQDAGGLPRYLPGIWSKDPRTRAEAERQSHSHRVQGSAQWMIQRAMSWLRPQIDELRSSSGMWIRWLLQIHDELIFGYDQRLQPIMDSLITEALVEHSYKLRIPVKASSNHGLSWGDLK